jgi:hypothetical protein
MPDVPDVLRIPADLTALLRQMALQEYSLACETAHRAADDATDDEAVTSAQLVELCVCRARVADAEDALELLGDDVGTREEWEVSLERRNGKLIAALIAEAIDNVGYRLTADGAASEQEIIDAADRIPALARAARRARARGGDGMSTLRRVPALFEDYLHHMRATPFQDGSQCPGCDEHLVAYAMTSAFPLGEPTPSRIDVELIRAAVNDAIDEEIEQETRYVAEAEMRYIAESKRRAA